MNIVILVMVEIVAGMVLLGDWVGCGPLEDWVGERLLSLGKIFGKDLEGVGKIRVGRTLCEILCSFSIRFLPSSADWVILGWQVGWLVGCILHGRPSDHVEINKYRKGKRAEF